jgi:hypothetical protein
VSDLHRIKVTIPEGRGVLSTITLDDEQLRGVTAASFAVDVNGMARVYLTMYADIVIEGEAEIVSMWRNVLPWWRRLPYWMHRSRT